MTEPTEPIYADHAATTPLDPEVFAAMRPWLTDQYANPAALYRSGLAARRAVEQARRTVAACLGCAPHQIFFTSGGSEGNTWAILNGAGRPGPGSREVVTTGIEHHSVSGACAFLQKQGVTVCTVPVDAAVSPPGSVSGSTTNRITRSGHLIPHRKSFVRPNGVGHAYYTPFVQPGQLGGQLFVIAVYLVHREAAETQRVQQFLLGLPFRPVSQHGESERRAER